MKHKKIKIYDLKIIKNSKGDIKKYLDKKILTNFKVSEVYFSEIKNKEIKGWNLHKKATCLITVVSGKVKFKIRNREFKLIKLITMDKKNYKCIQIPPGTWFSFESMSENSIIVNTLNLKHQKNETKKIPI